MTADDRIEAMQAVEQAHEFLKRAREALVWKHPSANDLLAKAHTQIAIAEKFVEEEE